MSSREFFHIDLEMLGEQKIFPFHIYVFNPLNKQYSPYLFANSPLTEKKIRFLEYIIERDGVVAVSRTQKRTFLKKTNLKEDDVPSLKEPDLHVLIKANRMYKKILESKDKKDGPFVFQEEFKKALTENDFSKIIERTKDEVLTFSVSKSQTVSLAIYFCEKLLKEDNNLNRIVVLTYHVAKISKMDTEEVLSDIICASYLHHVGITQIDYLFSKKPLFEMGDEFVKDYKKHAGLSHHLLRKSDIELNSRCIKAILEHHERADGSGYPAQKLEMHIEPLALLLGAVSHIIEYSAGKVDGNSRQLESVINNLANKSFSPGLEFEFGDTIYNNLINLINNTEDLKKAA